MFSYVTAFCLTIVLILFLRRPAIKLGLVDTPVGRKNHVGAPPLIGGLAIFIAFMLAALSSGQSLDQFYALFAAMIILVLVGLLDDLHDLSTRSRFIAQIFAALLMTSWGGVVIEDLGNLFGGGSVHLYGWAIPFTVFSVLGVINALNMIDGIDGLAGGVSLTILFFLGAIALFFGMALHASLIFILVAAVLGFLIFNMRSPWRKKASIFMGDAGSMMLGFTLVWFAVDLGKVVTPVTMVWIFAIPLMDTVRCMVRRILKRRSPFSADSEHLHHLFLQAGLSVSKTVLLIMMISILMGLIGLAGWYFKVRENVMLAAFLLIFAGYYWAICHSSRLAKKG